MNNIRNCLSGCKIFVFSLDRQILAECSTLDYEIGNKNIHGTLEISKIYSIGTPLYIEIIYPSDAGTGHRTIDNVIINNRQSFGINSGHVSFTAPLEQRF